MLRPFGYQVERCSPSRVRGGGLFVVDDGGGHAYALRVGEHTVVSFHGGVAELLSISESEDIIAGAASGPQKIYIALEVGTYSLNPPSLGESDDSLCGAKTCKGKAAQNRPTKSIKKRPASCFPAPKRRKRRMYARPQKLCKNKYSARRPLTFATATPSAIVSIERSGRGT